MSFTKPDSYCTEKSATRASSGLDDVEVFWISNTTVPLLSFTLFPIRDVTFIRPPSILWITRKKIFKKYIYHHLHIMNNARNLNDVRKCSLVYIYRNSLKKRARCSGTLRFLALSSNLNFTMTTRLLHAFNFLFLKGVGHNLHICTNIRETSESNRPLQAMTFEFHTIRHILRCWDHQKVKLFIGCLSIWIFYRQVKPMFNVTSSTRGANLKGWRRIPEYFNAFCWHKV